MEEQNGKGRSINHPAISEMSNSDGWKELEKMLEWDVKFGQGLLERGRRPKVTQDNPDPDVMWITDPHDIGRARGILSTAKKYLDLVKFSKSKNTQF
jgi:hypothetical protein